MTETKNLSSNRAKIMAVAGSIALVLMSVFVFIALREPPQPPPPVPAKIAKPVPTFMLPDNYSYRQDDTRWGTETIGATEDTMRAYGCTIASVAMSASNLTQTEITPQMLESRLTEAGGFTDRGWLIWDKVQVATDNQVTAKYFDAPKHEDINACMQEGNYPVIKIKLYGSIIHWVMVVGTTDDQYLIRDPLVGGAEDTPIELSERSTDIHGVRCIMKVEN